MSPHEIKIKKQIKSFILRLLEVQHFYSIYINHFVPIQGLSVDFTLILLILSLDDWDLAIS